MRVRAWLHVGGALVALALWVAATAFFAIVGYGVAHDLATGRTALSAPIASVHAAVVTIAYSLGGAAIGLGVARLAVSRERGRRIGRLGLVWLGVTALLVATRRLSGWPLLVASVVALGIGVDVCRLLIRDALDAWRADR